MSSGKGKRKREGEGFPLQGDQDPEKELMKRAMSSPRIQIVPGLWRRIVRRRRSKNDAKPWTCTCRYVNKPTQHLFFDLPRFKCGRKGCKEIIPDDYEFEFSLADIEANGVCPLGAVKEQVGPHCIAFSAAMNAEVTSRITKILLGEDIEGAEPEILMQDLLKKIKLKKQLPRSVDINRYDNMLAQDIWKVVEILEKDGVETLEKDGVETVACSQKHQKVCKISGKAQIPLDFAIICKEIAGGSPLLTSIRTGKGFDDLKHNEIYKPPKKSRIVQGKSEGLHAIALFGGGMRKGRKTHYEFVNTHGEVFCPLSNLERKDGITGGFGKVVSDGILKGPVKFLRDGKGILRDSNLNDPLKPGERTYAESSLLKDVSRG
ncbi:unnamed protein product [Urochloa decumbens]